MTGLVVWITGLPSAGKTTLAEALRKRLVEMGVASCMLDGDVLRAIIAPTLGYSDADREAFYAALARLAAELAKQGLVALVPATAHLRKYRQNARQLAPRFVEVWVTTRLAECRQRDSKGLYASAVNSPGHLPGVDIGYEEPDHAEVLAAGGDDFAAITRIVSFIRSSGNTAP
jgi:adenylylsulfate kinase